MSTPPYHDDIYSIQQAIAAGGGSSGLDVASKDSNIYLPTPTCLDLLRAAIGRTATGGAPARLLTRGDSTTFGVIGGGGNGLQAVYNPNNLTDPRKYSWVDNARNLLNASGLMGGPGAVGESISLVGSGSDSRVTEGTGWSAGQVSTGASGVLTFVDDNVSNAYDFVVIRSGSATTFTVTIDGGTAQTVTVSTVNNNTGGVFRVTVAGGGGSATAAAGHSVVVSAPAAGTIRVLQIEPLNTAVTQVLRLSRLGISGQLISTGLIPTTTGAGSNMNDLTQAHPDAVLLHMGINDMHFQTTAGPMLGSDAANAAAYQANVQAFVTAVRNVGADPILTVWPSYLYSGVNPSATEAALWHQALYNVADANNVAIFDLSARWGLGIAPTNYAPLTTAGNPVVTPNINPVPLYDGVHPTLAGYLDQGRAFARFLARLS